MITVETKAGPAKPAIAKYPYLAKSRYTDTIVLFTEPQTAVVISAGKEATLYQVGAVWNSFAENESFVALIEDVILRNQS